MRLLPLYCCYRFLLLLLLPLAYWLPLHAQSPAAERDSLRQLISAQHPAAARSENLSQLCFSWVVSNPDTALYYGQLALTTAQAAAYPRGMVKALNGIAAVYSITDHPDQSLALMQQAIRIAEENKLYAILYNSYGNLGTLYLEIGNNSKAKDCYLLALKSAHDNHIENANLGDYHIFLGDTYLRLHHYDSAIYYVDKGYQLFVQYRATGNFSSAFMAYGNIYAQRGQPEQALQFYRKAIDAAAQLDDQEAISTVLFKMAKLFEQKGQPDSAGYYAKKSLALATSRRSASSVADAAGFITHFYKTKGMPDSAFKYAEILLAAKDSLYDQETLKKLNDLEFTEHTRQQELAAERMALKNRIVFYGLGLMALLLLGGLLFLWRNNRQKQKANLVLETTLTELKSTQALLVQQEKMASLGELTAGIAHEIQNPLNFVNNFSELNKELLAELQNERAKPVADRDDSLETELLTDIENNSGKINEHGKRADAIVKGMLQHSRASSGKKEPTDINALCDEYLRLSYHGLRAKDKGFQSGFTLDLDPSVDKINVVAQDIGRVLLNLFNNAFYAVNEKRKTAGDGYAPLVTVVTRKTGERVLVTVADNGSGMPQQIMDKIFQPFFTTKPTGQGTGLGLSLAYDIVKAHGSVLQVSSEPGQGTVFSMML